MSNFVYYNSSFFNNPPLGTWEPENAEQFYNYLNSRWQHGTPMTYGGDGFGPTIGDFIDHVFPDPPSDPNGWNLLNEQLPQADRRTIMAAGPFDIQHGEEVVLDVAFSYHRQDGSNHIENVDNAFSEIPFIKSFYDNGFSNNCMQVV